MDHWMIPNRVYVHCCTKVRKTTCSLRWPSKYQSKIIQHTDENPGNSALYVAQELRLQEWNRPYNAKKKKFPYQISVLRELKPEDYTPHYNYCNCFFKFDRDVETMMTIFFRTKCGFICPGMLIRKITVSGWQIIRMFLRTFTAQDYSQHLLRNFWTLSHRCNFLIKQWTRVSIMKIIQDFIVLCEEYEHYTWFQQDRALLTWSKKRWTFQPNFSKIELYPEVDGRQEAQILRCQTFLWGTYIKNNVHRNKPSSVDELRGKLRS